MTGLNEFVMHGSIQIYPLLFCEVMRFVCLEGFFYCHGSCRVFIRRDSSSSADSALWSIDVFRVCCLSIRRTMMPAIIIMDNDTEIPIKALKYAAVVDFVGMVQYA